MKEKNRNLIRFTIKSELYVLTTTNTKFFIFFFLFLSYWDIRQPKNYGEEFRKYKFICPFMTPKMMLFAHSETLRE
jgi:hypothetical protein